MHEDILTRQARFVEGVYCNEYEIRGHTYLICDSIRNALLVSELLEDEEMSQDAKQFLLPAMVFVDLQEAIDTAGEDFWEVLLDACWSALGIDLDGRHNTTNEDAVIDFKQDASRIRASFLQVYGMSFDDISSKTSYIQFMGLIKGLLESGESSLQQAVYYRTAKPPKRTKYNEEEIKAFRKKQEYYRIKTQTDKADSMKAQNNLMASAFSSEFNSAKRR